MNVCGVLVQTWPERVEAVRKRLLDMAGVEIHATTPDGRLVVTVEHPSHQHMADAIVSLHRLEEVLSAALVYQYSDEFESEGKQA